MSLDSDPTSAFERPAAGALPPQRKARSSRAARTRNRRKTPGQAPAVSRSRAKRLLDVVIAAAALVALSPLLLLIAVGIKLESRGPALFGQRRGGLDGRPFVIYKFRTMAVMEDGPDVRHATRSDPRVTRFGAVLRKTSLDELPQLINVLKGDMSLVGPRPHAIVHDQFYGRCLPSYSKRQQARPGLTGLAQVSGCRGEIDRLETMADRVALDLEYISRWSLLLDLELLALTFVRAPSDRRAY